MILKLRSSTVKEKVTWRVQMHVLGAHEFGCDCCLQALAARGHCKKRSLALGGLVDNVQHREQNKKGAGVLCSRFLSWAQEEFRSSPPLVS